MKTNDLIVVNELKDCCKNCRFNDILVDKCGISLDNYDDCKTFISCSHSCVCKYYLDDGIKKEKKFDDHPTYKDLIKEFQEITGIEVDDFRPLSKLYVETLSCDFVEDGIVVWEKGTGRKYIYIHNLEEK